MSYFDAFSSILGSSWIHHCQYCRRKTELLTTTLLLELKTEDKTLQFLHAFFDVVFSQISIKKSSPHRLLLQEFFQPSCTLI